MSSIPDRWFTPRTARQTLDALRPVAETLCRLYRKLESNRPARILPEQKVDPVYFALIWRLHSTLGEIHRCGAQVQDLRQGQLAFPARRAGRPVLLCWRVGEATLGFWQEPEAGLAGRRPVDEDGPWEEDV
jgi:hypothetical protein